jgi:transcriptional regulator with PAS, ATPase and Fis domain
LIKENANLFESVRLEEKQPNDVVLNISPVRPSTSGPEVAEEVQDITHEAEDDSLSIEKKERELILRALRKNNNKRKYAARDLGISERTLYRKIKEYELEED